jgi:hypothetical protein
MKTREQLIEDYLKEPLKIGDSIFVQGLGSQDKKSWFSSTDVVNIIDNIPYIKEYGRERPVTENWVKSAVHIGVNPFAEDYDKIRSINFQFESILHQLYKEDKYDINGTQVMTSNDNPFVFINGEKKYYQRPLCWSLEDKQLLIDSIYNFVDCGKILIRNRGWEELEELQKGGHELSWRDIIDGKQRINAVKTFMDNEYPDSNGNYFNDLSERSQRRFTSHQLFSYSELPENSKDEDVLRQFLKLNFAGVPQSKDHIDYIKSLL